MGLQLAGHTPFLRECFWANLPGYAVRLATLRYVGGLASYFEVLEAQQQLFPAENNLAQTMRDQLLATVFLYKELGGGWGSDDYQPPGWFEFTQVCRETDQSPADASDDIPPAGVAETPQPAPPTGSGAESPGES